MATDRNDMCFWFPPLAAAGLPVPRTHLLTCETDLISCLDGEEPEGFTQLIAELTAAAKDLGYPCFMRTGHLSGKHSWERTCYLRRPQDLPSHVFALVEASVLAGIMGLPTTTWALREMIATAPLFHCRRYGGMPVVREFRLFIRDHVLEHTQFYWPQAAVAAGDPDVDNWSELLSAAALLPASEQQRLQMLGALAVAAVGGGYWSVDFLQARNGHWYLTDMATGADSFRYDGD